jgi:hypothetical protein
MAEIEMIFYKNPQQYKGMLQNGEIELFYDKHKGFLRSLYNHVTQLSLDKRYVFLQKCRGIAHAMLLCCLCQALKLSYITKESEILLEASGYVVNKPSMDGLVEYYKKIGFTELFPEYYEEAIVNFVPMIGKVQHLVDQCSFKNVSQELLNLLPIKLCKDICI